MEKLKDEFEKDVSYNIEIDRILARELARVGAIQLEEPDLKQAQEVSDLDNDKLERKYRYKLGYLIYNHVGRKGFNTLLSS